MKTSLLASLVALIVTTGAFAANNQPEALDRTALVARVARALDRLDLDKSQRDQIKAVLRKNLPAVKPNIQKLVTAREALTNVIRQTPGEEGLIRAQSAKVAAVESDLAVQRASISKELRAILRPEQIAEFTKLEQDFRARIEQRVSRLGSMLGTK
jgi:Spy/CpxP family protein refolding chaperone